jgi:uncharacterized membrane protein HdeD (DUF308 family)
MAQVILTVFGIVGIGYIGASFFTRESRSESVSMILIGSLLFVMSSLYRNPILTSLYFLTYAIGVLLFFISVIFIYSNKMDSWKIQNYIGIISIIVSIVLVVYLSQSPGYKSNSQEFFNQTTKIYGSWVSDSIVAPLLVSMGILSLPGSLLKSMNKYTINQLVLLAISLIVIGLLMYFKYIEAEVFRFPFVAFMLINSLTLKDAIEFKPSPYMQVVLNTIQFALCVVLLLSMVFMITYNPLPM